MRGARTGAPVTMFKSKPARLRTHLRPCFTKAEAKRNRMRELARRVLSEANPNNPPVHVREWIPKVLKLARMVLRS